MTNKKVFACVHNLQDKGHQHYVAMCFEGDGAGGITRFEISDHLSFQPDWAVLYAHYGEFMDLFGGLEVNRSYMSHQIQQPRGSRQCFAWTTMLLRKMMDVNFKLPDKEDDMLKMLWNDVGQNILARPVMGGEQMLDGVTIDGLTYKTAYLMKLRESNTATHAA